MDAERIAIARACLNAAHDGSLDFPLIVGKLIAAGFDSYLVDYRRRCQTYYLPYGDSITLDLPHAPGPVAPAFDADRITALVRWAQAGGPDYSYDRFSDQAAAAGCAFYLVSFAGRRVVYFGRTGETHIEHMPG